jgi:hypothetical protein
MDRNLQVSAAPLEGSMLRNLPRLVSVLSLLAVGCSNSMDNGTGGGGDQVDAGSTDMTDAPDLSFPKRDPTDHPPLPTMDYYGGPTLAAPEVWTIVWQGDEALGAQVNGFVGWMLNSDDYWTTGTGEYGVGKGKAMGVIVLPVAAPATLDDSAVGPMIKAHIADGLFPKPNANTLLAFVVPAGTKSTMYGAAGCQEYGGYHAETRMAAGSTTYVPYAINLQCAGFSGGSLFDSLTMVTSHEVAEASTDPHPFTKPGYVNQSAPLGGEDGDLCNPLALKMMATVAGDADAGTADAMQTYVVARLWSNKNAKAGNVDPCQPAPKSTPYFNVAVDPTDIQASTVTDPNGMDITAKIEPYAYGDVGAIKWTLEGQPGTGIKVSPTSGTANAGDTIGMTVHIDSTAMSGTYPILLFVQAAKGGHNLWTSSITIQ